MSLWLAVLLQAIRDIKYNEYTYSAYKWLSDRDNIIFDTLAESLGYEPPALRELIFKNIKK
jgi:hypothetical protein